MSPSAISSRVVADHLRAMTFLIADGVLPSNEWRGYVLRKIMRRAMRHGKRLGATAPFLHRLVDVLVAQMGDAYPELRQGRDTIVRVIRAEEDRFDVVLSGGLPKLEELLEAAAATGSTVPGDEAFKLYDTFGLPLDFIEDLASERKLTLDRQAFDRAMEAQRDKARAKSAFDRKADEFVFGAPTTAGQLERRGRSLRGLHDNRRRGRQDRCAVRRSEAPGGRAPDGGNGVRRPRPDTVLRRGRRTGLRYRRAPERGRRRARARGRCGPPRRRACPVATTCRSPGGRSRKASRSARSSRRAVARCDAAKSHGHAPASRGAPPGARHAREAGGVAGGARSPAVRLHALRRPDARGDRSHRAHRQRADLPQRGSRNRGAQYRRSDGRRRDGAVRREVRRTRARRDRAGLQRRAVRRHAYARHRGYRLLHDHRGKRRRRGGAAYRGANGRRRGPRAPGPPRRRCGSCWAR